MRLALAGVGGAFGGREDISLQVHTCLLALRTGRPVKMQYGREESFFGHVHRHPATIWMRHHATADGRLVKIEARFVLDGGAYASTSSAVLINAVTHAQGPYACPNAVVDGWAVRTNNPPCGAMRGFGVVQACFAHEGQMDKLAAACGLDPVELRLRNAMRDRRPAHHRPGRSTAWRRWRAASARPRRCRMPTEPVGGLDGDVLRLPGGAGRTADAGHVRARRRAGAWPSRTSCTPRASTTTRRPAAGWPTAWPRSKFATAEVGQGFVTHRPADRPHRARRRRGACSSRCDTAIGSAGSTSASRQTWMSGGAVDAACRAVRERLFEHVGRRLRASTRCASSIDGTDVVDTIGDAAACRSPRRRPASCSTRRSSTTTGPPSDLDENGQGNCHVAFAFVAHRAVVDVDVELGLVKVVQIATAQDVGVALNPLSVLGQIEGGIAQGLGLAVMEEIVIDRRPHPQRRVHRLPAAHRASTRPRCVVVAGRGARPDGAARRQGRGRAAVHLGRRRPSWPPSATPPAGRSTGPRCGPRTSACERRNG